MALSEIELRIRLLNNRFAIMSIGENRRVAEFSRDEKEIIGFCT